MENFDQAFNDCIDPQATLTINDLDPFMSLDMSANEPAQLTLEQDLAIQEAATYDWFGQEWANGIHDSFFAEATQQSQIQAASQAQSLVTAAESDSESERRNELILRRYSGALAELNEKYNELESHIEQVAKMVQTVIDMLNQKAS